MPAEITLSGNEIAVIIGAVGSLIALLATQIIRLRSSRSSLNLKEDTHLYTRLRQQQAKQDARITQLEQRTDELMDEVRECEIHRAACETKVAYLEEQSRSQQEQIQQLASQVRGGS